MELVTRNYIKATKTDIFNMLIKYSYDKALECDLKNILKLILDYEQANNYNSVCEFYINKSNKFFQRIIQIIYNNNLPIKRQSIINASVYALYNNEIDIAKKLTKYFSYNEINPLYLNELKDYVLDHSLNINEYFNGENDKLFIGYTGMFSSTFEKAKEAMEKAKKIKIIK